jgi:hypothetical protein
MGVLLSDLAELSNILQNILAVLELANTVGVIDIIVTLH